MKTNWGLVAILFIFLIGYGFSLNLVSVSKTALWVDDGDTSVDITFSLESNESVLPNSVIIYSNDWQMPCSSPASSGGNYKSTCSLNGAPYGNYSILLQCQNQTGNSTTIEQKKYSNEFTVYRLSLENYNNIPTSVYSGDILSVNVKFLKNGKPLSITDNPSPEFSIYMGNNPTITYQPIQVGDHFNLTATVPSIAPGTYDLKIIGKYGNHEKQLVLPGFVNVKSPLNFNLLSPLTTVKMSGNGNLPMTFSVKYKGKIVTDISSSNIDVEILNQDGDVITSLNTDDPQFDSSKGTYTANIIVPDLSYGEYYFKVSLTYNGIEEDAKRYIDVQIVIPFEGAIVDPKGHAIQTTIDLINNQTSVKSSTNSNGEYSMSIVPGTYDMDVCFPGMTAELYGVDIEGPIDNAMRYDEFTPNVDIQGLHTAKLVVFEFAMPFKKVILKIPYDDSKVVDEQKLEVYTCHNWNFGRRACAGEWQEVPDPMIDTVRNIVTINMTHLSAFAIGERKSLYFSVDFSKDSYYMEEPFTVRGKVVDESGNPVKEAKVLYWFDDGEAQKVSTDDGGFFYIATSAPSKVGGVTFHLRAEKNPYIPTEISQTFSIYRKSQMSVIVPDTFAVDFDTPSSMNVTIRNTGQTNLSTVTISVDGLKPSWYVIYPSIIDSLSPGQSKNVQIKIDVPKSDCSNEQCKTFYFVNVNAKSGKTSATGTITMKLNENSPSQTNQTATGFSIASELSFLKSPYFITPVLILIIVAVFVYLIKQKEKKRKTKSSFGGYSTGNFATRDTTMNKIHAIKSKIVVEEEKKQKPKRKSSISSNPFKFKYYKKY